jgi:hypothetical protein
MKRALKIRFLPHDYKRKDPSQLHPDSSYFFQAKDVSVEEADLRADAHQWETTMHKNLGRRYLSTSGGTS